jgi:hypothetical protein
MAVSSGDLKVELGAILVRPGTAPRPRNSRWQVASCHSLHLAVTRHPGRCPNYKPTVSRENQNFPEEMTVTTPRFPSIKKQW